MVTVPPCPPDFEELMRQNVHVLWPLLDELSLVDDKAAYLHWDKLRFKKPPKGLSSEQYWAAIRWLRNAARKEIPFADRQGNVFSYCEIDQIKRALHYIDGEARGSFESHTPLPHAIEGERYLIRSLIEEPYNSSVLEGAATTRAVAKELISEKRLPRNLSEQMVLNNYIAMRFIKEIKDEPLTPAILREVHKLITKNTLEKPNKAGEYRQAEDEITVQNDITGEILHMPPPASSLPQRIDVLCEFANKERDKNDFIHPLIRATLLHFMLAYDHPFVDGNGRTARALFYWSVLRDNYWLLEYISISKAINEAPTQYAMAFLHSETDQGDLTYFIIHQMKVIEKAVKSLHKYINDKAHELQKIKKLLSETSLGKKLNYRQLQILEESIKSPHHEFFIANQEKMHGVSYLTARKDLEELVSYKFLQKIVRGRNSVYKGIKNLAQKIRKH